MHSHGRLTQLHRRVQLSRRDVSGSLVATSVTLPSHQTLPPTKTTPPTSTLALQHNVQMFTLLKSDQSRTSTDVGATGTSARVPLLQSDPPSVTSTASPPPGTSASSSVPSGPANLNSLLPLDLLGPSDDLPRLIEPTISVPGPTSALVILESLLNIAALNPVVLPSSSGHTSRGMVTPLGVTIMPSLSSTLSSSSTGTIAATPNISATITPSPTNIASPTIIASNTITPSSSGSGPAKNSKLDIGAMVGIIVAAIACILAHVMILVWCRRRRRVSRAALRPDAYTPQRSGSESIIATDTMHNWHASAFEPPEDGADQSGMKGSRFSVATVASSIPAPTIVSSVEAELSTLDIDSHTQPTILAELPHAATPTSTSELAETSHKEPRNVIQEVLGALRESLSSTLRHGNTSDVKPPETVPRPPPRSVRAIQRGRPGRLRETALVLEEDGGVRLAGGPSDEPPQEFLPPPYRRY